METGLKALAFLIVVFHSFVNRCWQVLQACSSVGLALFPIILLCSPGHKVFNATHNCYSNLMLLESACRFSSSNKKIAMPKSHSVFPAKETSISKGVGNTTDSCNQTVGKVSPWVLRFLQVLPVNIWVTTVLVASVYGNKVKHPLTRSVASPAERRTWHLHGKESMWSLAAAR